MNFILLLIILNVRSIGQKLKIIYIELLLFNIRTGVSYNNTLTVSFLSNLSSFDILINHIFFKFLVISESSKYLRILFFSDKSLSFFKCLIIYS